MSFYQGLDTLGAAIAQAKKSKREAINRACWAAGEHVLGVSNDAVPHEQGKLEATGGVSQDKSNGTTAISYRDVAYPGQAVDQHEDFSLQHDEGRHAKYLEGAMASERAVVEAIIGQEMKGGMGF